MVKRSVRYKQVTRKEPDENTLWNYEDLIFKKFE